VDFIQIESLQDEDEDEEIDLDDDPAPVMPPLRRQGVEPDPPTSPRREPEPIEPLVVEMPAPQTLTGATPSMVGLYVGVALLAGAYWFGVSA